VGNDHLDAQTSARLLRRAQAIKGGRDKLAETLGVHPHDLALWMAGKAFPPQVVFERVLEIILDAHEQLRAQTKSTLVKQSDAPLAPSAKPRVLVADSTSPFAVVSRILGEEFDLVPVHTVTDALDILQGSSAAKGRTVDAIVCGQHFEGSQMLHFLECVKTYKPTSHIPFICYRAMASHLSDSALAAMRETCEALGGVAYIDIADSVGRRGDEAASVQFRDAVRAAVRLPKDVQGLHVLVADDNPDAAHTLTVLLRMSGYQVYKAANGTEALRIAEKFQPAVVVLDIGMPGITGYAVAEQIRAAAQGKPPTLIALTGHSAPEEIERARQAGFDHYFVKPVALERLLQVFPKCEA
jgi:CheY-like chemotaxis protein